MVVANATVGSRTARSRNDCRSRVAVRERTHLESGLSQPGLAAGGRDGDVRTQGTLGSKGRADSVEREPCGVPGCVNDEPGERRHDERPGSPALGRIWRSV